MNDVTLFWDGAKVEIMNSSLLALCEMVDCEEVRFISAFKSSFHIKSLCITQMIREMEHEEPYQLSESLVVKILENCTKISLSTEKRDKRLFNKPGTYDEITSAEIICFEDDSLIALLEIAANERAQNSEQALYLVECKPLWRGLSSMQVAAAINESEILQRILFENSQDSVISSMLRGRISHILDSPIFRYAEEDMKKQSSIEDFDIILSNNYTERAASFQKLDPDYIVFNSILEEFEFNDLKYFAKESLRSLRRFLLFKIRLAFLTHPAVAKCLLRSSLQQNRFPNVLSLLILAGDYCLIHMLEKYLKFDIVKEYFSSSHVRISASLYSLKEELSANSEEDLEATDFFDNPLMMLILSRDQTLATNILNKRKIPHKVLRHIKSQLKANKNSEKYLRFVAALM